jgi:hypothetical protein
VPDDLEAWRQVVERGYEGLVAKDEASAYEDEAPRGGAGRTMSRVHLTDNQKFVGVRTLALICAERTRQAGRFQSSSAPRVLLGPRGEQ